MKGYKQFSLEERERLFAWREQKQSLRTIACTLGRSHTTLSRELRRNLRVNGVYIPCSAHSYAYDRLHKQRSEARLKSQEIYAYVVEHLKMRWSPETIAGRLPIDRPGLSIHQESIYRYIYWDNGKGLHLWNYLLHKRPRRMKKGGRRVKPCGKIPEAVSIDLRPQEASDRRIAGHWETDNVIGKATDKTAISTTVERATRYTILSKLAKTAEAKQAALVRRLWYFPSHLKKTMTTDNGSENMNHKKITSRLNMLMFFCHAFHSWEKGTVENMNGRIRRFIPKGRSIDVFSEEEIAEVEYAINHTPRKCLGFLTPDEAMAKALKCNIRTINKKRYLYAQAAQWLMTYPL